MPAYGKGCGSDSDAADLGTVIGAIGGGLLGNEIGDGAARYATTAVGALVGAYVGRELGSALDPCEQEKVGHTVEAALDDERPNQSYAWKSDTNPGTRGVVVAGPAKQQRSGTTCRVVVRKSAVGGREIESKDTFCRTGDGDWEPA
jgi:surface antigen